MLQFDGAIDTQVRYRAFGQVTLQHHIDRAGAVLHRRINADDLSRDDTVASIDSCRLANLDILSLGFRYLNFSL